MENCPISGKPCPHKRNIHVTDVANGTVNEMHLCEVCGLGVIEEKKQPETPALPPFVQGLFDLLKLVTLGKASKSMMAMPAQPLPVYPPPKPPCPGCGATLQDIAQTSRLGCGVCYEHFKNELIPVLIHAHKATEHTGKKPKFEQTVEEQIKMLTLQLKQAIDQEQYELAKEIKEQLDKLSN